MLHTLTVHILEVLPWLVAQRKVAVAGNVTYATITVRISVTLFDAHQDCDYFLAFCDAAYCFCIRMRL